jgi:hypothetical protein
MNPQNEVSKTESISSGINHKLKSRFPKVRQKNQRAFLAWLCEHQSSFKRPLQFVRRKDDYLEMSIPGLNPSLNIYLSCEISVSVNWQGCCWDLLVCFDTVPRHSADDYYCALYEPEYRTFYANRKALWQAELFDPFLNWLNNKLFLAKWLGLYRVKGGTWAELLDEPDPKASVVLPVWLPPREGN